MRVLDGSEVSSSAITIFLLIICRHYCIFKIVLISLVTTCSRALNFSLQCRYDSDIPLPYSWIRPKSSRDIIWFPVTKWLQKSPYERPDVASRKTKLVALFVSNCHTTSKRENLVRELSNYIPVDIYGGCGNMSCPRSQTGQCIDILNKDYKFYLAFENSLCRDYVTEKFFNMLQIDVSGLVHGKRNCPC